MNDQTWLAAAIVAADMVRATLDGAPTPDVIRLAVDHPPEAVMACLAANVVMFGRQATFGDEDRLREALLVLVAELQMAAPGQGPAT